MKKVVTAASAPEKAVVLHPKMYLSLEDLKYSLAVVRFAGLVVSQLVKGCVYALPWIVREVKLTLSERNK